MANPLKPKRSWTPSAVPLASEVSENEWVVNYADKVAYTKNAAGNIVSMPLGGSGGSGSGSIVYAASPSAFPGTGSSDNLYIATESQKIFRWATSAYVECGPVGSSQSLQVTIPGVGDEYWTNVALLLRCNGSNGSTTFTDNSPSPKNGSQVGNAVISTAQSKWGGASLYVDGNGDYVEFADDSSFDFGANDFVIESWIRIAAHPSNDLMGIVSSEDFSNTPSTFGWWFGFYGTTASTDGLLFGYKPTDGSRTQKGAGASFELNTWYYVAVARVGNSLYFYKDGVLLNAGGTAMSSTINNSSATLKVGSFVPDPSYQFHFNGFLDELRITNGAGRYGGSTMPVPTGPLATGAYTAPVVLPCLPAT